MKEAGYLEQSKAQPAPLQPSTREQHVQQDRPLQRYAHLANGSAQVAQLNAYGAVAQRQSAPKGGLPGQLKSGIESLSGLAMDDVRVHYNSSKPAQLQAHAYAEGTDIHIAPGQERHLPHEAWHVVQQKQGRVKPTLQLKGIAVNDDSGLEREADVMGERAMGVRSHSQVQFPFAQTASIGQTGLKTLPLMRKAMPNIVQCLPILRTELDGIRYYQDVLVKNWKANYHEVIELKLLAAQKEWEELETMLQTALVANPLVKATGIAITDEDTRETLLSKISTLDLTNRSNLKVMVQALELAQDEGWDDLEAILRGPVLKMEDAEMGPMRGNSMEPQGGMDHKEELLTIDRVMGTADLKEFLILQDRYQSQLRSMDNLQSAGFEFEFASFTAEGKEYVKDEIIPSHKLMASSALRGNFFKLTWHLESDSENTLELVSPPLVFPKTKAGKGLIDAKEAEIARVAQGIADGLGSTSDLSATANRLTTAGIGQDWKVESAYERFGAVKKVKSGGQVYGQQNISLYPAEIADLLMERFTPFAQTAENVREPEGMAINIHKELIKNAKAPTESVNRGMAVFARYCSNALAIPGMRHRQDSGVRKYTTPTQVKESLGIWVKTDALNLLQPLLVAPSDQAIFKASLSASRTTILNNFGKFGEWMVNQETPPPTVKAPSSLPSLRDVLIGIQALNPTMPGKEQVALATKNLKILTEAHAKGGDEKEVIPPSVGKMKEYVALMLLEVEAFIDRALRVNEHKEMDPTSTTEQFLQEQYGSGGGVRKGTYIKGVPTSGGKMYVTEIRPQM